MTTLVGGGGPDGKPGFMFKVLPPHFQPHGVEEKASKAKGHYWQKKKRSSSGWARSVVLTGYVGICDFSNRDMQLCLEVKLFENA